jgi:hypothetical protein
MAKRGISAVLGTAASSVPLLVAERFGKAMAESIPDCEPDWTTDNVQQRAPT